MPLVRLPESNRSFSESDQPYTVSSPFVWIGGAGSNWSTAANWAGDVVPSAGSNLLFEGTAPIGGTVDDFPAGTSFNSIELAASGFGFSSDYALTLTGGITLDAGVTDTTISADVVLGGPVTIDVSNYDANTEATLIISGVISGSGSLMKGAAGTLKLTGSNNYSSLTTVNDGVLELGPNAQSPVLCGGGADIKGVGADVTGIHGRLVLDYGGASDPAATVQGLLAYSWDGEGHFGLWDRGQFRCSTANAHDQLGWMDDGARKITIARTLCGDANLDGTVDSSDLGILARNWKHTGTIWAQGDFNYDDSADSADLGIIARNWKAHLGKWDLSLAGTSTFGATLTDDGPDTIDVTGAVSLGNATLNVTSSRTNPDYGTLRVLIQNDGTDPVIGTFKDLPEGSPITTGDETYYITYQYNAETGQFGTGNDVALYSSSLFNVSYVSTDGSPTYVDDGPYLDAEQYMPTYCVHYQLSIAMSQGDNGWPNGNPTLTYSSDTPSMATVSNTGEVTFLQTGECRIRVVATEDGGYSQTFEVPLVGVCVVGAMQYLPDAITSQNVGNYVLVLYNEDSTGGDVSNVISSTALKAYYKANRPGMGGAAYLGITAAKLQDAGYDIGDVNILASIGVNGTASWSAATPAICQAIAQYVSNYVENYLPSTRYIVGLSGLPSGDGARYSGNASVPYQIYSTITADRGKRDYDGQHPFSVAEYGGPLVAWLDCGSYEATKAYIDKEATAAGTTGSGGHTGLLDDQITISGTAAGVNGTNWIMDDVNEGGWLNDYLGCFNSAIQDDVGSISGDTVTFNPNTRVVDGQKVQQHVITTASNPAAYVSFGVHSGQLDGGTTEDWANDGDSNRSVNFSGNAGWWIGASIESFDGIYGEEMADPMSIFSSTAFGSGRNGIPEYANTPVCWVGHTGEPGFMEVGPTYFVRWAQGWNSLDAAWAGRADSEMGDDPQQNKFLVVTDVCLRL